MAIALYQEFPGFTEQQYEAVLRELNLGGRLAGEGSALRRADGRGCRLARL